MSAFRREFLWRPTRARRESAARWLPWLLRDDESAARKLDELVNAKPVRWLTVLAGLPSTRWLALLRPHAEPGEIVQCGPSRREVEDLGGVICQQYNAAWLRERYPGPLNDRGQDRLADQADAIERLLARCVALRTDAELAFAVHVAGDHGWTLTHTPNWRIDAVERALRDRCAGWGCDISTDFEESFA